MTGLASNDKAGGELGSKATFYRVVRCLGKRVQWMESGELGWLVGLELKAQGAPF